MNQVLDRWNSLDASSAASALLSCCGSTAWADALTSMRPIADEPTLLAAASAAWLALPESAWNEAFDCHPRIGQNTAHAQATPQSLQWSAEEQRAALLNSTPSDDSATKLADANRRYEQKFGRIFILCAYGRTTSDILANLEARLHNDASTELREAAEQQRRITELRLQRWLHSESLQTESMEVA